MDQGESTVKGATPNKTIWGQHTQNRVHLITVLFLGPDF